jgi:hypothetical protein
MSFKLKPSPPWYNTDLMNVPIYFVKQIKDGRLAYDDKNIYHRKNGKGKWKVKKRSKQVDGSPINWWEAEAYKK